MPTIINPFPLHSQDIRIVVSSHREHGYSHYIQKLRFASLRKKLLVDINNQHICKIASEAKFKLFRYFFAYLFSLAAMYRYNRAPLTVENVFELEKAHFLGLESFVNVLYLPNVDRGIVAKGSLLSRKIVMC